MKANRIKVPFLLLLVLFAANSFYTPSFLGDEMEQMYKASFYLSVFLYFLFVCFHNLHSLSRLNRLQKQDIRIAWLLILLFVSIINTNLFKEQPFLLGLMASMPFICDYVFYFALRIGKPSVESINRIILVLGCVYLICISVDAITMPNVVFGSFVLDEERGGIRLSVPGIFWCSFLLFYSISKYKECKSTLYLFVAIVSYIGVSSLLARQYIVWAGLLGIMYLIKGSKGASKVKWILIVFLALVIIVPKIPIVQNLVELSKEQKELNDSGDEEIRLQDYKFFVYQYPRNTLQFLFGCGVGSYPNSKYGREIMSWRKDSVLIPADAGWAGYFFYYGAIPTLILLVLIIKSLTLKIPEKDLHYKYQLAYMSLCAIGGGTIIYHHEYIIFLLMFYVLDKVKLKAV